MGYTTEFEGALEIKGTMTREFVEYINRFSNTRRMKRDVEKIKTVYPDWKKLCFNGELGVEGEYLATNSKNFGQEKDDSIIDYNNEPATQPSLWCQWIIETNEDLNNPNINEFTGKLIWDGGEKFYYYVGWLEYMIAHFFVTTGLELSGAFLAVGEDTDDARYIIVDRNEVFTFDALEDDVIEEIRTEYNDNKVIIEAIIEVAATPDEIHDKYWYWSDDDDY